MATRYKTLYIKRFGWKRIAREFQRMGWKLNDAYEHTNTTYTDHYDVYEDGHREYTGTTTNTKISISLHMSRDLDWYENGHKIHVIDVFFSLFFVIRRLLGTIMPINIVIFIISLIAGGDFYNTYFGIFFAILGSYLGFLLLEIIFSFIGKAILKGK